MKRMLLLAAVSVFLCGCSQIHGTWTLAPDQPKLDVTIATMTLASDGTFTAEARYDDTVKVLTGFYEFDGKTLEFDTDGKHREYQARVEGDDLYITHRDVTVRMKRLERDEDEDEHEEYDED